MSNKQTKNIETDGFSFAREQFETLVQKLRSENQAAEHGDVESLIDREGREILRELFQAHLDLRAIKEEKKR